MNGNWASVGEAVRRERMRIGLSQADLARLAGVSESVIYLLENAKQTSYKPRSLRGVCAVLGWTDESIQQLLEGGEPTPRTARGGLGALIPSDSEGLEVRVALLERQVLELNDADHAVQALEVAHLTLRSFCFVCCSIASRC